MQAQQISSIEKTNLERITLILSLIVTLGIALIGVNLLMTEEIFSRIIGTLLVIAFLGLLFCEYKFYSNNPWGWFTIYLVQIFLLISLIFIAYSELLLDFMDSFYVIVIKKFATFIINFLTQNPEYDIFMWFEDVFLGGESFLNQFGILIGSLFILLNVYWLINYLTNDYTEYELLKVKKRSIIGFTVFFFIVIIGIVFFLQNNVLNVVFGGIIGCSGFLLLYVIPTFQLTDEIKANLSRILLWTVFIAIAVFSGDLFIFTVMLFCFLVFFLLNSQTIREKFDILWTSEQREERIAITLILPTAAIVIFIVLVPVIWAVISSFFDIGLRNLGPYGLPAEFVGLDNYEKFLRDDEFFTALSTSILYTILGTFLSLIVGLIAALLLNRTFKGRGLVRGVMLFPYISSTVAIILLWRWAFSGSFGIVNALLYNIGFIDSFQPWLDQQPWAFVICVVFETWKYFPFAMLMILARLQAINSELYEAADIDGANDYQKFRNITLPELRYVLGVVFLLRTIWTFNKFDDVYLFTGGSVETGTLVIPVYIFDKVWTGVLFKISEATAVAVFLVIGLIAFVVLFGKKVLEW